MKKIFKENLSGIAFALAITLILGTGSLLYSSFSTLIDSNRSVKHTLETISALDHLLTHLNELETGPRGYVITGEKNFLNPYFKALAPDGIEQHLGELRQLNTHNPAQQGYLASLYPLIAKKIQFMQKVVALRKQGGFDAAQALIATDVGNSTMEEIRHLIERMRQRETVLLHQRSSVASASLQNSIFSITAGGAISVLLLSLSFIMVNHEVGARKRDAEQLRLLNSEQDQRVASRTMQLNNELEKRKESEAALKKSEQQFREMFENNTAVMIIYDPITLHIIDVNQSATEFYGWTQKELCRMNLGEINTLPHEELHDIFEKAASGEIKYFISSHRRADGLIRDVEVYPTIIVRSGSPHIYSIIHDITERRRIERANQFHLSILEMAPLKTVKELLQMTIDEAEKLTGSTIGFLHYVDDNQLAITLQGWSTNTITTMCKVALPSQHYSLNEAGIWADALRKRSAIIHNDYASNKYCKGMPEGHAELRREAVVPIFRNNKIVALLGVGNKALDYNEDDTALIGLLGNVAWDVISKKITDDEHKILQVQQYVIENLAMHDSLTGLPNRRLLSERIDITLAQCRRNKTTAALFIFDLDKFKAVNDTLGHQIGDLLLKEVATRTLGVLRRSGDSLARLGGDEYVVLLPQIAPPLNAVGIAEKIRNAILQPFELEGHTINISCSIGIALYPEHGEDEQTLMKHADAAMYQAKNEGLNRIKLFSAEIG